MAEKQATTPVYLAYSTFKNAIQKLAPEGKLPDRIDNSVLGTMSGATRTQFVSALRFFKLIDDNGVPTEVLKKLAVSGEPDWKPTFKPIFATSYAANIIETLGSGTPASIREAFGDVGPSILKPAVRFLVKAAQDVGIPVGAHIKTAKKSTNGATAKRPVRKSNVKSRPDQGLPPGPSGDFKSDLLAKFPSFDPSWNEAQQSAWFASYQKLLDLTASKGSG